MVEYVPEDWIVKDFGECRPNPYASGYGRKIPTSYKVCDHRRWRCVYAICIGNVAGCYCLVKGKQLFIQGRRFP